MVPEKRAAIPSRGLRHAGGVPLRIHADRSSPTRVDTRTRPADDVVEALAKRLLEARTLAMH
jgi:hypothetical protein